MNGDYFGTFITSLASHRGRVYGKVFSTMQKSEPSNSAASLLGTVTTLVKDTQVDVTRLIYMLYQDVEHQINRADLKAQITLSTSAVLTAMLVNLGTGVRTQNFAQMQVFEGVALHLGWILQALEAKLPVGGGLRFVGGGANSTLWGQILADVTGKTIETLDAPQLCGARGAASLAVSAAQPPLAPVQTFAPIPANQPLYRARLELMQRVYRANRPLFPGFPPT